MMNMLTGFSAHLQKPRRRQKPIVTILFSERPIVTIFNEAFKIIFLWSYAFGLVLEWSHICDSSLRAKGLITLLLYCSKGKWRKSLCNQIATHYLQLKFVLLAYDVTVLVLILL